MKLNHSILKSVIELLTYEKQCEGILWARYSCRVTVLILTYHYPEQIVLT